jgi:hypothetical protein
MICLIDYDLRPVKLSFVTATVVKEMLLMQKAIPTEMALVVLWNREAKKVSFRFSWMAGESSVVK